MESDRMGYLLPALTEAKFSNQRDVVLNERRQNYENRPYGLAPMAMLAALFPPDHPVPLDDDRRDRRSARGDGSTRCAQFFSTLLPPGQRVARARRRHRSRTRRWRWRARTSRICRRARRSPPVAARRRRSTARRRLVLEDRVELPRLYLAWLTPAMFADGDAELDLAADMLANGKTSRLYRRLVFEERIATDVSAAQNSREIGRVRADRRDRGARAHARRARTGHRRRDRAARGRGSDATTRSSAAACRPKRSSCSGCRRSAASAASPIS